MCENDNNLPVSFGSDNGSDGFGQKPSHYMEQSYWINLW